MSDGFGRLPIYCVAKSGNWPAVIHLLFLCEQSRQASHAVEEARKGLSHRECASDETRFLETFQDHLDIISKYPESTQKYVDLEPGWRAEYRCQVQDPISCMSGKGFASAEDKIILKGFCTSMFTRCQRLRLHQQILANVVAQPSLRTLRSSTRNWECSPSDDSTVKPSDDATKTTKILFLLLFSIVLNIYMLLMNTGRSYAGDDPMV